MAIAGPVILVCNFGPDAGKQISVGDQPVVLGSGERAGLRSDDPSVADEHVVFVSDGGSPRLQALAGAQVLVNGQPTFQAPLAMGQQITIGESYWQVGDPEKTRGFFGHAHKHMARIVDLPRVRGFSVKEFLGEVLSKHSDEETEAYFTVGSETTTPSLERVDTSWPRPWAFARTAAFSIVVYLGLVFGWNEFKNVHLIPGIIMVGSLAFPGALLIFFFEVNVLRNVSLYQVAKLFLIGGMVSLIVSLVLFSTLDMLEGLGAMAAGIIEEPGKAVALAFVVNRLRYRWILNGLLFGATVGAGFAVFESMGYALRFLLEANSVDVMRQVITLRGALTLFGSHILWTALIGAALWRVRGARPFEWGMLADARFLRVFGLVVLMHMAWNAPATLSLPFYGNQIAVGIVGWLATLGFIQAGLREVRDAQVARLGGAEPSPAAA